MTIIHALGDPIDTFWSFIHKVYIWNRLYAIGLEKSPERLEDMDQRRLHIKALDSLSFGFRCIGVFLMLKKPLTRDGRARIIATVLAGFEDIAGAKIQSEDYYHMITKQLGNLGEPNEDATTFEQWRRTARILADARTNEFPRNCLAIFVYIFGLIAAFLPSTGGGNTLPPGGRIGSAIFLSWLVPLVLVSNTIGAFTSRRACLTIMSHFVSATTPLADIRTTDVVSPLDNRRSEESVLGPTDMGGSSANEQDDEIQMLPLRNSQDIAGFADKPFKLEPFTVETSNWPEK